MSLSISTVVSYSEALADWLEDHWDELRSNYKLKFGVSPDDDAAHWLSFCQKQFDDEMSMFEDHNPLEDR